MFQRRWYILTAWGWFLAAFGFSLGFVMLKVSDPLWARRHEDLINSFAIIVLITLGAGCLLWTCWAVPFFGVKNIVRRSDVTPAGRVISIKSAVCIPAGVLVGFGIVPIFFTHGFSRDSFQWTVETKVGTALIGIGITLGVIGWQIARRTVARLHRACIDEKICFKCTYDLRGSESPTCPECGFENKSIGK